MSESVAARTSLSSEQVEGINLEKPLSFESLFEAHWNFVFALLYRITGDPDEADELALETFWKLYQRTQISSSSMDIKNLRGWLYRTAANAGLNSLRSRKRRERYEVEGIGISEGTSSEDPTAHAFERLDQATRVRAILAKMRKRDARLLILRYQGLRYAELAEVLGISKGSVGKMLARAESAFERLWQEEEGL